MKIISDLRRLHYATKVGILVTVALITGMAISFYITPIPPTSPNPEIRTWYDLDAVRDNLDGNYTLMNNLDSTIPGYEKLASPTANRRKGWKPIGTPPYYAFTGIFDGQGYEIRDLFINRPDEDEVGILVVLAMASSKISAW